MADSQARQLGITRPQLATALQAAFDGTTTGVYREGDELLPIIARAPEYERSGADNIQDLQIWSPAAGRMIPMRQVLTGFATEFEDTNIWRRDRSTTIKLHCDADGELASALFARIKVDIEKALDVDLGALLGNVPAEHTTRTVPIRFSDQIPGSSSASVGYWGCAAASWLAAGTSPASGPADPSPLQDQLSKPVTSSAIARRILTSYFFFGGYSRRIRATMVRITPSSWLPCPSGSESVPFQTTVLAFGS